MKAGAEREVEISARLREVLVAWRAESPESGYRQRIAFVGENNFGKRHFAPLTTANHYARSIGGANGHGGWGEEKAGADLLARLDR